MRKDRKNKIKNSLLKRRQRMAKRGLRFYSKQKFDRDFLNKVIVFLQGLRIDLFNPVIDINWSNSVLMRGDFAGYSINDLIKFWQRCTGKKVKWIGDNYN